MEGGGGIQLCHIRHDNAWPRAVQCICSLPLIESMWNFLICECEVYCLPLTECQCDFSSYVNTFLPTVWKKVLTEY